jgi:hypothetical protein
MVSDWLPHGRETGEANRCAATDRIRADRWRSCRYLVRTYVPQLCTYVEEGGIRTYLHMDCVRAGLPCAGEQATSGGS